MKSAGFQSIWSYTSWDNSGYLVTSGVAIAGGAPASFTGSRSIGSRNASLQTPSPLGGGALIAVYDDGAEVGSLIVNPVFFPGEAGTWFDITTGGGMVFDEVRFLGFGFSPASYVDNLTWNAVPAPGSVALLGLGGAFASRRRR